MRVIDLEQLRPHPQDAAELAWFFNESEGAMGVRSNFGSMKARLEAPMSHSGVVATEMDERQVEAASRARLVRRSLEGIAPEHRDTLRAAYTARRHTPERPDPLKRYRDLAGLVEHSPETARIHKGARSARPLLAWLERIARPGASLTARTLHNEVTRAAECQLAQAARAYAHSRKAVLAGLRERARRQAEAQQLAVEVLFNKSAGRTG